MSWVRDRQFVALSGHLCHLRRDAGQATVELVALLALVVFAAAGAFHVLAAGAAHERAAAAAHAGAVAALRGMDPVAAARAVADDRRATVRATASAITVTVPPPKAIPVLREALSASATERLPALPGGLSIAATRGGDGRSGRPEDRGSGRR